MYYYQPIVDNVHLLGKRKQARLREYIELIPELEKQLEYTSESPWSFLLDQTEQWVVTRGIQRGNATATIKMLYADIKKYLLLLQEECLLPEFEIELINTHFTLQRRKNLQKSKFTYREVPFIKMVRPLLEGKLGLTKGETELIVDLVRHKYHPDEVEQATGKEMKKINQIVRKFSRLVLGCTMNYLAFWKAASGRPVYRPRKPDYGAKVTQLYKQLETPSLDGEAKNRHKRQSTRSIRPLIAENQGREYRAIEPYDEPLEILLPQDVSIRTRIPRNRRTESAP